jgi:hypothetical protein
MEIDMMMSRLDSIRDVVRIAYGSDGDNRKRLFEVAHAMLVDLAKVLPEQTEEDDE